MVVTVVVVVEVAVARSAAAPRPAPRPKPADPEGRRVGGLEGIGNAGRRNQRLGLLSAAWTSSQRASPLAKRSVGRPARVEPSWTL